MISVKWVSTARAPLHRSPTRSELAARERHGRLHASNGCRLPLSPEAEDTVLTPRHLKNRGWTPDEISGQVRARRWQRHGRALVLHNSSLTWDERCHVALINCGPRSVLTSFTAAQCLGLTGWGRSTVHVLVPGGARISPVIGDDVAIHYTAAWNRVQRLSGRPIQRLAPALVVAAASTSAPRTAIGLLAAAVQQRKLRGDDLRAALAAAPRTKHHRILTACVDDITQGSQALSEIDFVRLCRRNALPTPTRQAVRMIGSRRRYLDAEWVRSDGRRVVAEVDGALHLVPATWYTDQVRQNEIVLSGSTVLRFPSFLVRTDPALVVSQLRCALRC
jgi:hypothetical protein